MDLLALLHTIDAYVWGPAMIALLLGSHLFLTFKLGFIQKKLPLALKLSVSKDPNAEGEISQFGALTTALSATIGTGNIVGVATAILAGGPGAVFWMWLTGVFGMATKYAETYVALRFRATDKKGHIIGGAMVAWRYAFGEKSSSWWARLGSVSFALFAALAAFGIGAAVQASAMTSIITANVEAIPSWLIGVLIAFSMAIALFGGVSLISRICEKLVPFMALFYATGCIYILVSNASFVPDAITLIVCCAFTPQAAFGGAVGSGLLVALQFGCARGLFSNESGLGSAPIVAAAASSSNPARQSLVSMTGTFWDTVVICALTGIMLVSTMLAHPEIAAQIAEDPSTFSGAMLTSAAFKTIPLVGSPILVLGMIMFSYSTILGWSYYGNRCATFMFGTRGTKPYQIVYILVAFLGAIGVGSAVWVISDITNALMVIPNIILVLLLSGMVRKETKHFVWDGNIDELDSRALPHIDK